jgi:hypothetical protein
LADSHLEKPSIAPHTRFGKTALREEEQAHKNGANLPENTILQMIHRQKARERHILVTDLHREDEHLI